MVSNQASQARSCGLSKGLNAKTIIGISFHTLLSKSKRKLITHMENKNLNPNFVTGFSVGESAFVVVISINKELKTG